MVRLFGNVRASVPQPWSEITLMAVAFLCGATIGFERERHEKPAGLRTLVLICVGSAIFTVASVSPSLGQREPARIAAQIVTGVGFLGAGSILRERFGITGLTTAATVWATAGVGMVIGAGYATAGVALSLTILITLAALKRIEEQLAGKCRTRRVIVRYRPLAGKARLKLQQALDASRGPHHVTSERTTPDGSLELGVAYCVVHKEHRAVMASIADVAAVEAIVPDV